MIAIREAWDAGLLRREHWLANIIAGVIVGIVALPLAMAFAIASGVKPEQGIYTAIIAGALVSLLGGSRVQIAGPTGAFIVILAAITAKHGVEGLQIATVMAGIMLIILGATRLGGIIKFIPDPVIVGFTAGIGVIIWVGQWRDFLGLPKTGGEHFHQKIAALIQAFPHLHMATTGLALLSLFLVLYSARMPGLKKIPSPLIAMLVATVLQSLFHFNGVMTIGDAFGEIPQGLPPFKLPDFTLTRVIELVGPAFAIAMLCAIESLLCAVVADGMTDYRHDSNQELIGQGIANVIAPLFGGFAATGAIARTATNIRNGGNSPLAGITHAVILILILIFLAPLATNIPLCALAAILFVVAYNMSELKHFSYLTTHAPRADVAILWITFLLTVFTDLVVAVNIGVILAILQFFRRMASAVDVQQITEHELQTELGHADTLQLPPDVMVYMITGPLFFGAAETLERVLTQTHTDPRMLVIRLKQVPFMDATGLQTLQEVIGQLQQRSVKVVLCEANIRVLNKLEKMGLLEQLGVEGYHSTLTLALNAYAHTATDHR